MRIKDFNLSKDYLNRTKSLTINDQQIKVKSYLPVKDKLDLIQIALQKSEQNGIYNDMKLDIYFHLNIIYLYTDIEFEQQDREDQMELFDILESNNVINRVINCIGSEEYGELKDYLNTIKADSLSYKNTAAAVMGRFIQDLPTAMAEVKEIIDSFDPSKYQAVADFAIAANGGRDIRTNLPIVPQEDALPEEPPRKPKLQVKSVKKKS